MELEFSYKYKDYELRACPKRLVRFNEDEPNETIDLIKWETTDDGERYCYSLAYWVQDKEGYDLKFVDNRPFKYIDTEDIEMIWTMLKAAQETLDTFFRLSRELNEKVYF